MTDRPPDSVRRNHGLDTLRALAIALVFAYHYMVFVSHEATFGWTSEVGWVGVDLFFVLSGYLIANQILAGVAGGQQLSLGFFYARRALRTLPVFWVVLAAYVAFPAALGGKPPPPLWTFLTFTQNFGLQPGTAFSHAWSLCIEEQFYLVLPMVALAGVRYRSSRTQAWALLFAGVALGVAVRGWLWTQYGRESTGRIDGYYPNVYYATLCRFDEFLPGVAVALLKNLHRPWWVRVIRHGNAILGAGIAATAGVLYLVARHYWVDGYGYGFFMTTFGYSLVAMAFALLVVAALSPDSWLYRLHVPGAAPLALWSYSIYLSHKAIGHIVAAQLKPLDASPALLLAAVSIASLLGGFALYRCVEAPAMALRARHFPSSFCRRGTPPIESASPWTPT